MKRVSLKSDAERALAAYNKLPSYSIQEDILQRLVEEYPDHKNVGAVDTKVKLLNLFYSTGIQATNLMTAYILSIKDIDARLKAGDKSLVAEIATLKLTNGDVRFNYSFATKYCALHQPTKYPIYDSIVADTFESLFVQGYLPKYTYSRTKSKSPNTFTKGEFAEKLKEYDFFVDLYKYFMELFDLTEFTVREIDAYIWGAFKVAGEDFEIERLAKLDKSNIAEVKIE